MTRKRFKKLLMSKGFRKNEVNKILKNHDKCQPYEELYYIIKLKVLLDYLSLITGIDWRHYDAENVC